MNGVQWGVKAADIHGVPMGSQIMNRASVAPTDVVGGPNKAITISWLGIVVALIAMRLLIEYGAKVD